ncbi:hypothetical protein HSR121_0020 [Halapricum desulfuricans]|uniref:Uncharacterized protein n=1 Tax=Halapricum desulfuricans TaxID=2841257 RepID=A0A897MZ71_9EURY|nr:hypothetical protein HSR121_0020 [Halapricum desulfuricans]
MLRLDTRDRSRSRTGDWQGNIVPNGHHWPSRFRAMLARSRIVDSLAASKKRF